MSSCEDRNVSWTNLNPDTTFSLRVMVWVISPLIQSAATAAEPTLMAATLEDAKPGSYFGPTGFMEMRGHPAEAEPAPCAKDDAAARGLFEELESMTGLRYAL